VTERQISQGRAAKRLKCGGIFNENSVTHSQLSVAVKELPKLVIYASAPLGGANAYMFYSPFFVVVVRHDEVHNYETTVLWNG